MYFSNIHNPELQHFHNMEGGDFTMSLTDLLDSDLFEVEEIADNLYRVFPLFYCNNIVSSNKQDKILDNRCLIITRQDSETYFSFMTNNDRSNVIIDDSLINVKNKGDKLSIDDFNALVYQLRKNNSLNGEVDFEDTSMFEGVYATYQLDGNDDIARNDTGFIITPELKNNPLTIKLINPFFKSAKYTVTCTVKSIIEANVCDSDTGDFKTSDTFSVNLIENQPVQLDISDYTDDSVLLFNMSVSVSFNVPEIVNTGFELSLSSNKVFVPVTEGFDLTANLTSTGEVSVEGYIVEFFEDDQLIGSETTNMEGVAVLNDYTNSIIGEHTYTAKTIGLTANVNVRTGKYDSNITLTSDKSTQYITGEYTLTGKLTCQNEPLLMTPVKLYKDNTLIDTLTTDVEGEFSKTITADNIGSFNYQIVYEETDDVYGCSSNVTVNVRKINTNCSYTFNKTVLYVGETLIVTGRLTDEFRAPIADAEILFNYSTSESVVSTDSDGYYTAELLMDEVGTVKNSGGSNGVRITFGFDGDATHNQQKYMVTLQVLPKLGTELSITEIEYMDYNTEMYNVNVDGVLTDSSGNPLANKEMKFTLRHNNITDESGTIDTNSMGRFSYTNRYILRKGYVYSITITFEGDEQCNPSSYSGTITRS